VFLIFFAVPFVCLRVAGSDAENSVEWQKQCARQMADGQLRGAMEEGGQGSRAFTAPRNSHTHWALCQCLCNALRVRGARQIPYFLARLVGLISHL